MKLQNQRTCDKECVVGTFYNEGLILHCCDCTRLGHVRVSGVGRTDHL